MKVEGVTFNDRLVRSISREEFVRRCKPLHFLDRPSRERCRMLGEIYDRILSGGTAED